ncbi:MAG: helix-hairpin-helix domain-containing protein [Bacteroidota bacterium]
MIKQLLCISVLAFCLQACGETANTSQAEATEAVKEAAETVEETVEKVMGVINPNQAGAEALTALGLNEGMVKAITDNRPFLSQGALNTALASMGDSDMLKGLAEKLFVPINLNTASREEILLVPGVGERMAHEFEEYRPYKKIDQFRREMGKYVSDEEIANYEKYVFVPVELNSASKEEIMAIPGVGERIAHEFEEYRPYTSIEQFRRELGKYVDDKELARLERYVRLDKE